VVWVGDYARRFKNLVDPIYRWYREGADYRNLFRFNPDMQVAAGDTRSDRGESSGGARKQEAETLHAAG
jgi:hypothetical protein